jgi:hypothetical protein
MLENYSIIFLLEWLWKKKNHSNNYLDNISSTTYIKYYSCQLAGISGQVVGV